MKIDSEKSEEGIETGPDSEQLVEFTSSVAALLDECVTPDIRELLAEVQLKSTDSLLERIDRLDDLCRRQLGSDYGSNPGRWDLHQIRFFVKAAGTGYASIESAQQGVTTGPSFSREFGESLDRIARLATEFAGLKSPQQQLAQFTNTIYREAEQSLGELKAVTTRPQGIGDTDLSQYDGKDITKTQFAPVARGTRNPSLYFFSEQPEWGAACGTVVGGTRHVGTMLSHGTSVLTTDGLIPLPQYLRERGKTPPIFEQKLPGAVEASGEVLEVTIPYDLSTGELNLLTLPGYRVSSLICIDENGQEVEPSITLRYDDVAGARGMVPSELRSFNHIRVTLEPSKEVQDLGRELCDLLSQQTLSSTLHFDAWDKAFIRHMEQVPTEQKEQKMAEWLSLKNSTASYLVSDGVVHSYASSTIPAATFAGFIGGGTCEMTSAYALELYKAVFPSAPHLHVTGHRIKLASCRNDSNEDRSSDADSVLEAMGHAQVLRVKPSANGVAYETIESNENMYTDYTLDFKYERSARVALERLISGAYQGVKDFEIIRSKVRNAGIRGTKDADVAWVSEVTSKVVEADIAEAMNAFSEGDYDELHKSLHLLSLHLSEAASHLHRETPAALREFFTAALSLPELHAEIVKYQLGCTRYSRGWGGGEEEFTQYFSDPADIVEFLHEHPSFLSGDSPGYSHLDVACGFIRSVDEGGKEWSEEDFVRVVEVLETLASIAEHSTADRSDLYAFRLASLGRVHARIIEKFDNKELAERLVVSFEQINEFKGERSLTSKLLEAHADLVRYRQPILAELVQRGIQNADIEQVEEYFKEMVASALRDRKSRYWCSEVAYALKSFRGTNSYLDEEKQKVFNEVLHEQVAAVAATNGIEISDLSSPLVKYVSLGGSYRDEAGMTLPGGLTDLQKNIEDLLNVSGSVSNSSVTEILSEFPEVTWHLSRCSQSLTPSQVVSYFTPSIGGSNLDQVSEAALGVLLINSQQTQMEGAMREWSELESTRFKEVSGRVSDKICSYVSPATTMLPAVVEQVLRVKKTGDETIRSFAWAVGALASLSKEESSAVVSELHKEIRKAVSSSGGVNRLTQDSLSSVAQSVLGSRFVPEEFTQTNGAKALGLFLLFAATANEPEDAEPYFDGTPIMYPYVKDVPQLTETSSSSKVSIESGLIALAGVIRDSDHDYEETRERIASELAKVVEFSRRGSSQSARQAVEWRRASRGEFREMREYRRGDALSSVDWKAFARTDKLYVRTYEEEYPIEKREDDAGRYLIDGSRLLEEWGEGGNLTHILAPIAEAHAAGKKMRVDVVSYRSVFSLTVDPGEPESFQQCAEVLTQGMRCADKLSVFERSLGAKFTELPVGLADSISSAKGTLLCAMARQNKAEVKSAQEVYGSALSSRLELL